MQGQNFSDIKQAAKFCSKKFYDIKFICVGVYCYVLSLVDHRVKKRGAKMAKEREQEKRKRKKDTKTKEQFFFK